MNKALARHFVGAILIFGLVGFFLPSKGFSASPHKHKAVDEEDQEDDDKAAPKAIELMASGVINVKPLLSAIAPLEDGPKWFERLYAHEPNLIKVVLTPGNVS